MSRFLLMMLHNFKIIVVIPALNESKTIKGVVEEVKTYSDQIIVVDDGSGDDTANIAQNAGAVVIRHKTNCGYDKSIEDGFHRAAQDGASIFVTFDADGQHDPQDIKKLTGPIMMGEVDIAVGQRQYLSHFSEKIYSLYTKNKFKIKDPLCGLKAYSRSVYDSIGHFDTLGSIGTQLMIEALRKGFKVKTIQVSIKSRPGKSRFYFNRVKANWSILKAAVKVILLIKK